MDEAFYLPAGPDRFLATDLTRGPWDPRHQHGGPPAALLARAIEACPGDPQLQVARVTIEILRPIPVGPVTVAAEVLRPGRRVQLVGASLRAAGDEILRAHAWRIRSQATSVEPAPPEPTPSGPAAGRRSRFFDIAPPVGYHTAMELRVVRGDFTERGPGTAWFRMTCPLVAGEAPSPLQRVLVAADSGNGLSALLDPRTHLFVNPELTVHLHRLPEGEWVCLEARTTIAERGVGLTETVLSDQRGPIGRAAQALFVAPR